MKTASLLYSLAVGASMLAPAAAQAQTQYSYQKINAFNAYWTVATEVTDDSRVGGWTTNFMGPIPGFVESNGSYTAVTLPGYNELEVRAINGSTLYGVVNANTGFAVDAKGNATFLKGPNFSALPNGVNKLGVVVGEARNAQGNQPAFLLQNGTYQTYLVSGSNVTRFVAINNTGAIVGTYNKTGGPLASFQLHNGQQTPVQFPGAYSTVVTGLNDAGQMIGWYLPTAGGAVQTFFYNGTTYSTIPNAPNSTSCQSAHLNNLGQFVTGCSDQQTGQLVSFLATPVKPANAPTPLTK